MDVTGQLHNLSERLQTLLATVGCAPWSVSAGTSTVFTSCFKQAEPPTKTASYT